MENEYVIYYDFSGSLPAELVNIDDFFEVVNGEQTWDFPDEIANGKLRLVRYSHMGGLFGGILDGRGKKKNHCEYTGDLAEVRKVVAELDRKYGFNKGC